MFTVYVLKSLKDAKRYIGFTSDMGRRLAEHNLGKVKSTKSRKLFELIYAENFDTKPEAAEREKFSKLIKEEIF
ncbi:MAG: GIY-YIG nuclease family protein [Melioribacteraceae bacterium]|nr:MAG: GIY-YIG nuclease family protein [Melioribacteraceae bacterium]